MRQGDRGGVRVTAAGREAASRARRGVQSLPGAPTSARILIVEDNDDGRELLAEFLGMLGFDVVQAHNGLEAIDQARLTVPHVVLMDLAMPVLDGLEATRRLRADPVTSGSRVIGLTAHAVPDVLDRATAAGCDVVRTKPLELTELVALIEDQLRCHGPNESGRPVG